MSRPNRFAYRFIGARPKLVGGNGRQYLLIGCRCLSTYTKPCAATQTTFRGYGSAFPPLACMHQRLCFHNPYNCLSMDYANLQTLSDFTNGRLSVVYPSQEYVVLEKRTRYTRECPNARTVHVRKYRNCRRIPSWETNAGTTNTVHPLRLENDAENQKTSKLHHEGI